MAEKHAGLIFGAALVISLTISGPSFAQKNPAGAVREEPSSSESWRDMIGEWREVSDDGGG